MYGGRTVAAIRRHHRGDMWPGFIAKDTFFRSDSSSLGVAEKGGLWAISGGVGFNIFSQRIFGSGIAPKVGLAVLGAALDGIMTLTAFSQDWNRYFHCPAFRITDIDNCIYFKEGNPNSTVNNVVAGVVTTLGSFPMAFGNSTSSVINLTFEGDTLEVWQNGVLKILMFLPPAAMAQPGILAGIRMLIDGGTGNATNNWADDYSLALASAYADFQSLDSVQRANSAVSPGSATEKGGAWTALLGSAGVNANTIYSTAADTRLQLGSMPTGNGIIQFDAVSDDWLNHVLGQLFRMTDKDNHLTMVVTGPINASLRYRAAGVLTAYATWSPALTNGVSANFRTVLNGAQFTTFVNNVQVANFTMAGAPLAQTGLLTGAWLVFNGIAVNFWNWIVQ